MPPPITARPLLVAASRPIDEVPVGYGLVAQLYPPAPGVCACCKRRRPRITAARRRCLDCATGHCDHNETDPT